MSRRDHLVQFEWIARDINSCLEFHFRHADEPEPEGILFKFNGTQEYFLSIPAWKEMKEYIEDMIEANTEASGE